MRLVTPVTNGHPLVKLVTPDSCTQKNTFEAFMLFKIFFFMLNALTQSKCSNLCWPRICWSLPLGLHGTSCKRMCELIPQILGNSYRLYFSVNSSVYRQQRDVALGKPLNFLASTMNFSSSQAVACLAFVMLLITVRATLDPRKLTRASELL